MGWGRGQGQVWLSSLAGWVSWFTLLVTLLQLNFSYGLGAAQGGADLFSLAFIKASFSHRLNNSGFSASWAQSLSPAENYASFLGFPTPELNCPANDNLPLPLPT